jgi:Ser/Thr protein kinase RdoA (MazF antagonist)
VPERAPQRSIRPEGLRVGATTALRRTIPGVDTFASLSRRAQLSTLRRLGRNALTRFGVDDARLTLQGHEQNTTFRVDARGGPYLLRMNRPGLHTPETVASELAWLRALRRDTDLGVPEPVAAGDGSLVVVVSDRAVPEAHACVLLRWLDGRFVDRGLGPSHLARVGLLAADLQSHAATWTPPPDFLRPQTTTLMNGAKVTSMARTAAAASDGDQPAREDADQALRLVETLVSREASALVAGALEVVWASTRALSKEPSGFGLIHGDLHYENLSFHRGEAQAIDFDDCGWGFHLYDLAVTLSELADRPRYDELRTALLDGYARVRRLPKAHATHLDALILLRRLQLLLWIVESREQPAFSERWQRWAREELDAIARLVAAPAGAG